MSGTRHNGLARPFDAVVVVGSLGARESFQRVLTCLPAGFPAAIVFDQHRVGTPCVDERILLRRSAVPVRLAEDGLTLEPSHLYIAPPDRQLVVGDQGRMSILAAADGVGHRSADGLLSSAAAALRSRMIGVVLSGRLDGGARGVIEVKRHGGRVIVEDPETAAAPAMPIAALATGCVDFVLSPERIGHALLALCAVTGAAELFRVRLNAGARR